jgi:hypothetical protein
VNADDAKESSENESNVVALDVRTSLPLATVLSSNANKQSLVVSEHGERFIFTSTSTHAEKCGAVRCGSCQAPSSNTLTHHELYMNHESGVY